MAAARRSPRPLQLLLPHQRKALPSEAAPLLGWLQKDWLALRQTVFPQLNRAAVSRELVRLQLPRLRLLRQRPPCPQGRSAPVPQGSSMSIPLPCRWGTTKDE